MEQSPATVHHQQKRQPVSTIGEYDPLTNWSLAGNFQTTTATAAPTHNSSKNISSEIVAGKHNKHASHQHQQRSPKKSRFAKAVFHDDDDGDGESDKKVNTRKSKLPDESCTPPNATKKRRRRVKIDDWSSDSDDDDDVVVEGTEIAVLSQTSNNSSRSSTPAKSAKLAQKLPAATSSAFGSKDNPLVIYTNGDVSTKKLDNSSNTISPRTERQARIDEYLHAKFTPLHGMLAAESAHSSISPPAAAVSRDAKHVSQLLSSVSGGSITDRKIMPVMKSALLRNVVNSSSSQPAKQHSSIIATAPKPTHNSFSSSSRRVAHRPCYINTGTSLNKNSTSSAKTPTKILDRTPIQLPTHKCRIPYSIRHQQLTLLIDSCLLEFRNDDSMPAEKIFNQCRQDEKQIAEQVQTQVAYKNRLRHALLQIRKQHQQPTSSADSGSEASAVAKPKKQQQHATADLNDLATVYKLLQPYILSSEQLRELGFPYFDDTDGEDDSNTPKIAQSTTAKSNDVTAGSGAGLKLKRICSRCALPYELNEHGKYVTRSQCIYHAKRAFSRRAPGQGPVARYLCCDDALDSPGCSTGKYHVSNEYPSMRGFLSTPTLNPTPEAEVAETEGYGGIFALDCEMLYSAGGLEVAKVTVVNYRLEVVYDSFIVPEYQIVDLNTKFSGLRREDFQGENVKELRDVQRDLLKIFSTNTDGKIYAAKSILIGHSLQSDLLALKIVHDTCVDTSMVWPHRRGPPFKRALRNLMREILQEIIQEDFEGGHDSKEDAAACMKLMLHKLKQDLKTSVHTQRSKTTPSPTSKSRIEKIFKT